MCVSHVYDIWAKCLRKWVKKCKIYHFGVKWPNSAKKGIFCIFWPIFPNIWPKCPTPLESVKFFWLFETLKSKIHFFHQKFYKGSPLWILGEMSATMKASGVTSHYFREKISSQFILVLWMTRKTKEPKIFENFSIFHSTLVGQWVTSSTAVSGRISFWRLSHRKWFNVNPGKTVLMLKIYTVDL